MNARAFFLLSLCLLFASNAAAQSVSFARSDFSTGFNPRRVATGDFNRDGVLDLAVANLNTISILLGNGDGSFGSKTDFATDGGHFGLVAVDFNADGKPDLAATNMGRNTISILLGNGDGTFGTPTAFPIGLPLTTQPAFPIVAGDFNRDGNIDLVAGIVDGISVLLGNGDGTLAAPSVLNFSGFIDLAVHVATTDLNGDGKLDLAVASGGSLPNVTTLLGDGNGGFGAPVARNTGPAPIWLVADDFNQDGKVDLVVADLFSASVSFLPGEGDGTFGPKTDFPTNVGPDAVITGDLNGDGRLDLAVVHQNVASVSVLLGNGDGTFGPKVDFATASPSQALTIGDFNADGRADLAVANVVTDNVSVLTNTTVFDPAGGSFLHEFFATSGFPLSVTAADFNRDGKLDLATADAAPRTASETLSILLGDGAGGFGPWLGHDAGETEFAFDAPSVVSADFNRDGRLDVAVSNNNSNTVSVLLGDGNGGFTSKSTAVLPTALRPSTLVAADFNIDGKIDLAAQSFTGVRIDILLGNGDGTFHHGSATTAGIGFNFTTGDFDRDGKLDLAAPAFHDGVVVMFQGHGDGTFGSANAFDAGFFVLSVITGDFNQDGKLDLVTTNNDKTANILLGNGDGTFGARTVIDPIPNSSRHAVMGDFNRDGKLDLAFPDQGSLFIRMGNGDGTFSPGVHYPGAGSNIAISAFDANADGKLDLAQAGGGLRAVPIFFNSPAPPNTSPGVNIVVPLIDTTTGTTSATVTFSNVAQGGTTTFTISSGGPPPPAGFRLGNPPIYFGFATTAVLSGPIEVCIDYSGISFGNEAALKLFHFEGGVWVDATVSLDTTNNIICANVTSLSAFAILEPEANQPPVAAAGPDQTVGCSSPTGTLVTLDGSGSSDPDGDALTFRWSGAFPEGGGTVTGVNPAVTLPLGTHTITLVVNDGQVDSAPDTVDVIVTVGVAGLLPPLGGLVLEGDPIPLPNKAFKQGRTLPLKLQLFCGGTLLTDSDVTPPQIVGLVRAGDAPVDLEAVDLDSGEANDSGVLFRFSDDGNWVYNLNTQGLSPGTYTIVIEMPDGLRYAAGFALR